MPSPDPARLRALLAEQRYRRRFLREDVAAWGGAIGIVVAAVLLIARNDLLLLGRGEALWTTLVTRALASAFIGACYLVARRARRPGVADAATVLSWLAIAVPIVQAQPGRARLGEYIGPTVGTVGIIAVLYFAHHAPTWVKAVPAFVLSLASLAVLHGPLARASRVANATFTLALVCLSIVGIVASRRFDQNRRQRFEAERDERRARRELAAKVEEIAAEKARVERLAHAKSEFLATMSHEFRTPMNAVIGLSELLAAELPPGAPAEHARTIRDSAKALLGLLDDILDFAKIDAGRLTLDRAPLDLRGLLTSTTSMLRPLARAKGIGLELDIAPEVPEGIDGDEARLRQVLVNLLSNAVKFTSEGKVAVTVSARALPAGEHEIGFRVSDTGVGIAEDALARIFQPFEQAEAGTTRRYGGTGLGLPICKRIVEAMGGEIEVRSTPGAGSTFSFAIRAAEAAPPRAPLDDALTVHPLRLLVVEDHPVNRRVALAVLARLGYAADTAEDGFAALAILEERTYDVVFVDVQMPGMSGLELSRAIREKLPADRGPRLVAMTANAFAEDRAACRDAGMEDFVAKPFDSRTLGAALERAAAALGLTSMAALDQAALGSLRALASSADPGFFECFCGDFLRDTEARLSRMMRARARGDLAELERDAHGLKAAAAFVGARELSSLAGELELLAHAGDAGDEPREILAGMVEELLRVERALARETAPAG